MYGSIVQELIIFLIKTLQKELREPPDCYLKESLMIILITTFQFQEINRELIGKRRLGIGRKISRGSINRVL